MEEDKSWQEKAEETHSRNRARIAAWLLSSRLVGRVRRLGDS